MSETTDKIIRLVLYCLIAAYIAAIVYFLFGKQYFEALLFVLSAGQSGAIILLMNDLK